MNEKKYTYQLSVIIVNYNVSYFLEQCLYAVKKASHDLQIEVFVVDNNSIDNSVQMVAEKFPEVKLIANKDNKGFSKANNQGIAQSDSKYILLLNPDTVVQEDTFVKTIAFMDANPLAGGLGVRMIDGKGNFLPESKRGLPTPAVAFYKIFGLSKLFPKSKTFGQYHLGHLGEFETNEIDILSGAFMMMRSEALDKVGLLDEKYFMYGEDIDLSYRIQKGGYKNYYFPETQIIHYKGESTKKSSVNYVFVFYRAMIIFAKQHFSQKNAKLFSFFIHFAIYLRAFMAIAHRFITKATLPIIDALLLYFGLWALTNHWEIRQIHFPETTTHWLIPYYLLIWWLFNWNYGAYQKPLKIKKLILGTLWGTAIILMTYALFPKSWQFSRLFILVGALWNIVYFMLSRVYLHFAIGKSFDLKKSNFKKYAIVGSEEEFTRVSTILTQSQPHISSISYISIQAESKVSALGNIHQLDQIVFIHQIDELIFCAKNASSTEIIHWMSTLNLPDIDFKIAQPDTDYLIGSNSIDTAGDLYVMNVNAISKKENLQRKRRFDFFMAVLLIISAPITIWLFKNKWQFVLNLMQILKGEISFVGLHHSVLSKELPLLKKGILSPIDGLPFKDENLVEKLNLIYARDYSLEKDIKILWGGFKDLDRIV